MNPTTWRVTLTVTLAAILIPRDVTAGTNDNVLATASKRHLTSTEAEERRSAQDFSALIPIPFPGKDCENSCQETETCFEAPDNVSFCDCKDGYTKDSIGNCRKELEVSERSAGDNILPLTPFSHEAEEESMRSAEDLKLLPLPPFLRGEASEEGFIFDIETDADERRSPPDFAAPIPIPYPGKDCKNSCQETETCVEAPENVSFCDCKQGYTRDSIGNCKRKSDVNMEL